MIATILIPVHDNSDGADNRGLVFLSQKRAMEWLGHRSMLGMTEALRSGTVVHNVFNGRGYYVDCALEAEAVHGSEKS